MYPSCDLIRFDGNPCAAACAIRVDDNPSFLAVPRQLGRAGGSGVARMLAAAVIDATTVVCQVQHHASHDAQTRVPY